MAQVPLGRAKGGCNIIYDRKSQNREKHKKYIFKRKIVRYLFSPRKVANYDSFFSQIYIFRRQTPQGEKYINEKKISQNCLLFPEKRRVPTARWGRRNKK